MAIKVEIEERQKTSTSFPFLAITEAATIILVSGQEEYGNQDYEGTILSTKFLKIGKYQSFNKETLKKFKGSITLSNED